MMYPNFPICILEVSRKMYRARVRTGRHVARQIHDRRHTGQKQAYTGHDTA